MRYLSGICAILLAALAAASPARAQDCPAPRVLAAVDMVAQRNGTMLVPVTIAGQQLYFSLGTASPISSITPALVKQLGLVREHAGVTMINTAGRDTNQIATAPDFAIGNLKGTDVTFLVEADGPNAPDIHERAGTLGADFLRAYDVDLDFATGRMRLISRDHCEGHILFWNSDIMTKVPMSVANDNKIVFPMTLDGHELQTILSSATPATSIRLRTAEELYDVKNDTQGNEPAGALNGIPLYAHRFAKLDAGGLAVSNPRIVMLPDLVEEDARHLHPLARNTFGRPHLPDLMLGMSTLRQLHLYIAYADRALYISPASMPPR